MQFLISFFQGGGFFMYPIALMLLGGLAICVERVYCIVFKYHADSSKLMQTVQKCIMENNIDEAIKICNSNKNAAIYQVFKAALLNSDRSFEDIQDHVEVAQLEVVPKLQERVSYLYTIANVATLLGLLGTIIGLVQTFEAIGAVEASQKQALLSVGISTAMNTTAFGLVVAIPCMLVYGFLFNRINTIVDELEHYTARLLVLLRTGSSYFDKFNNDEVISTEQTPKSAEEKKRAS